MSVKGRDKDFRTPKVSYLEFKHTEMDRVLTLLFPRLKFNGGNSRLSRSKTLVIEDFLTEFLDLTDWFKGFSEHQRIAEKWIETDLMDMVNRGKANQAIAAPRPLHGNTYKFRNRKHTRDYGASEQVYWMLYHARQGRGQAVLSALKNFFFKGYDFLTDKYDQDTVLDVETQALLRLDHQVTQDITDSSDIDRHVPLCIGNSDIFADDILRLLAYEAYMPRSVLVEYLKVLIAFHLAIYHLKLLHVLPQIVKNRCGLELCSIKNCPVGVRRDGVKQNCAYEIAFVVDMGDAANQHMSELARRSAERYYRQIPAFVQANFVVKKLDEMAEYLKSMGKLLVPLNGELTVSDLVALLKSDYDMEREAYFKFRLARLMDESNVGTEDCDPEIRDITAMDLGDFDTFIEILMAYRGKYHRQYITECIDSLLLKNREAGLLAQARTKGSPRRFFLGSKLLEVLLQLAVLFQEEGQFITRELKIEELLAFLRNRYGLYIDRLPGSDLSGISILDRRALRLNQEAFKRRLREIGFYEDLSDAYITQKVSPRYSIQKQMQSHSRNGRGA